MMTYIQTALLFIKSNAKALIAVVLAIALICGVVYTKHWYNDQITASYNLGVKDTDAKWEKVVQKNKDDNKTFKDDQQALADDLARQLAEEKAKNDKLKTELDKKQSAYRNSENGKRYGLDKDFVDIYNGSLGVK
ncbi:hypothetical protein [Salmonella phage NINP13076]|nr:hypothetical protein [Salmonella phage NINP13076]